MFNRRTQKDKNLKNNREAGAEGVVTHAKTIQILGEKLEISPGQIFKKYADGIAEYGSFDKKTGHMTDGIRVYPEADTYYYEKGTQRRSQRYEKGQFKNGKLFIGDDYNLFINYGETITHSTVVVGRLRLSFKYDSDYYEAMLDKAWIDEKILLETDTTYMSTVNVVNKENLDELHKYLPTLKEKQCASLSALNGHYLQRSSEFVKTLLEAAYNKELGMEASSAPKHGDDRTAHRIK